MQWCNAYTKSRILAYEDLALQCCSVQTASFFSAASTSGLDYGAQGATMRGGAASAHTRASAPYHDIRKEEGTEILLAAPKRGAVVVVGVQEG